MTAQWLSTTTKGSEISYLPHKESLGKVYFKKENKFSACL